MNTAAILLFLKRFILGEFVKTLAWLVIYKGVEKAIKKTIKKAEEKGWTNGVDLDEEKLASLFVDLVKSKPIAQSDRLALQDAIVKLIYGEDKKEDTNV